MGYDISEATHLKLDANRAAGRLCSGGARHCTAPARVRVTQQSWTYRIGEGEPGTHSLPFCRRHARQFPPGFKGVNFRVLEHTPY